MQSIGDFAESLVLGEVDNIKKGKQAPPVFTEAKASPSAPDIRNTKVPDSFMSEVLGEQYVPQEEEEEMIEEEILEEEDDVEYVEMPDLITESQASEMIDLLKDVRNLLQEMTMTGNIGVNLGPPAKDTKCKAEETRRGYKAPSKASVMRDSIRRRLKRR